PQQVVQTEISVLASDFPLSKFNLNTVETNPSLIISTVNSITSGESFDLVLDAKILDIPLSNIEVKWDIQGAQIQEISETTNDNGKIKLTLIADDVESIKVQATTSEFDQLTVSKEIKIIKTGETPLVNSEQENPLGENAVLILIPGAVIGSSILLRKRGLLEPISERFPIVESVFSRFDELFERIEITERFDAIKEKIPIIKDR
ncbi:MAG: Ig-like domain-containing protein, partial [Nitrosopumilus sp.]|nr:Ig-like domain-containing protein [Nitrosopumilus sp.]